MQLKRIEVIGDDEAEIGEATRRMSENYDFVVTRQALSSILLAPLSAPIEISRMRLDIMSGFFGSYGADMTI